jgi:hypothetical protein
MSKTLLCLVMLLAHAPRLAAQTHAPQRPALSADNPAARAPQTNAAADSLQKSDSLQNSDAQRPGAAGDAGQLAVAAALQAAADYRRQRDSLLADVRALAEESKELLNPLDAAAARAEVASAAWTLDREWSKQLLREALALTFPEEAYRAKLREHAVGSPLTLGSLEDQARGLVRSRVLKVASADPAFARELADTTARELGTVQQVGEYTQLAGAAAADGRLDEAGDLIRRAIEAEPTLMDIGFAINAVAARDRAEGDRLMLGYIESLRALPLSAFAEPGGAGLRVPINFLMMLRPSDFPISSAPIPSQPAGREVARAYAAYVIEVATRVEQAHGDLTQLHAALAMAWPYVAEYAPEYTAQFNALERASRRPDMPSFPLGTFADIKKSIDKRYEDRVKLARETKNSLDIEVAVNSAIGRGDFEEARKLLDMLTDERLKSQLAEMADEKESLYLTDKGDTAGAARLARQLTHPNSILRAYPPLIRRLAKEKDAASAQFLTYEAVARLKASAEKEAANDPYIPSALASVASSLRLFKQSRALFALSELALAVEPAGGDTALDVLDALVECASKARVTSEQGSPNFNAEVFARLSAADDARVRAAASRLEDRLQRVFALAAVYRADAERLNKKTERARPASTPVR